MTEASLKRRGIIRLLVLAGALIGICFVVSFVTAKWVLKGQDWQHDQPHGHQWLQQELDLTDGEMEAVNAFEPGYRAERQKLLDEFNRRIEALAALLRTTDAYSDEVTHAIHYLHEVHGDIQILSVEHYYDMLSVLPPGKRDALRDLAVNALSQPE
jgi:hypothetical protein